MLDTINHLINSLRQQVRLIKTIELIKLMTGVNANHGTVNCAHVALKVDELLSNGRQEDLSPVPITDAQLYTKLFKIKKGPILYSFTSDLRIIERHKGISINYYITEDSRMILEIDFEALKEKEIQLKRANHATIIDQIRRLPRRQRDGSAQGFIFYTHEQFTEGSTVQRGHMANFLVDRFDEVYFLDAQKEDPALWVLPTPPQYGYRPELFYINSLPTEDIIVNLPQYIFSPLQIKSEGPDYISEMLENYAHTIQSLENARDNILSNIKKQLIQEIRLIQSYLNDPFLSFIQILLHSPKVNQKVLAAIQNNIGEWYLSSCEFQMEFKTQRAFFHFRASAVLGSTDALVNVAICYYKNVGVPISEKAHRFEKAHHYFIEASNRGKLLPPEILLQLQLEDERGSTEARQVESLLNGNSNQTLHINTVAPLNSPTDANIPLSLANPPVQVANIHSSSLDPFSNVNNLPPKPNTGLPYNANASIMPLYAMKLQEISSLHHHSIATEQSNKLPSKRKHGAI